MSPEAQVHYLTRHTFDPSDSTAHAQAIIEAEMSERMQAVRQLALRLSALEATIAAVDAARHAAVIAGWSPDQLVELGLGSFDNSTQSAGRRAVGAPVFEQTDSVEQGEQVAVAS